MDRDQFDHVIRSAANVVQEEDIVVVGSQSILGSRPEAPEEMLRSIEADVYPKNSPEKAVEIDGALGDGSPFHENFGYYAHGVGPDTAMAPAGWEERLVVVDVVGRVGSDQRPRAHCLEPHDLVLSKCVANRERDWDFAGEALRAGIVAIEVLFERIPDLPVERAQQVSILRRLRRLAGS